MSQVDSDGSVIMDLEEYDFSVQPPRLRSRHVSEQVNTVSEMEPYTLLQPSMSTQSSIGYTYTVGSHVTSAETVVCKNKAVIFGFPTSKMDSAASAGESRYAIEGEFVVPPQQPNVLSMQGSLGETGFCHTQFQNVNNPAQVHVPHSGSGALEYPEVGNINYSHRGPIMVTDLSESYRTPVGKDVQHGDFTPYTTVGMAGGISSYPNATGLPSRPMCRDNPGIPRGYPEQTAHAVSVLYTPAPQHNAFSTIPSCRENRYDCPRTEFLRHREPQRGDSYTPMFGDSRNRESYISGPRGPQYAKAVGLQPQDINSGTCRPEFQNVSAIGLHSQDINSSILQPVPQHTGVPQPAPQYSGASVLVSQHAGTPYPATQYAGASQLVHPNINTPVSEPRSNFTLHTIPQYPSTSCPESQYANVQSSNAVTNYGTCLRNTTQNSDSVIKNKMLEPETYDGTTSAEWSEYIIHFEQIAEWNNWSESQKAKMLTIKLRGEAQKLLGSLSYSQFTDYTTLKNTLSQRFNPQEREIAYRCEFRNRRRNKDENPSDFGFALRRLGQKAYPTVPYAALEVHILDQFISGLGSVELQKHVQFHHPKTLEAAINLAIEYTAVVGSVDKITKPNLVEAREATATITQLESQPAIASLRPMEFKPSFSLQDLEQAVGQIVVKEFKDLADKLINEVRGKQTETSFKSEESSDRKGLTPQRERSPFRKRVLLPRNFNRRNLPSLKQAQTLEPRSIICTYCSKKGHIENRCWIKERDMERQNLAQKI